MEKDILSTAVKNSKHLANLLIQKFKGSTYTHGLECLDKTGKITAGTGKRALLVTRLHIRDPDSFRIMNDSLREAGVQIVGHTASARPHSPHQDVYRIRDTIRMCTPDCVVAASGGSGIDATKAANILATLGGELEDYFGTGKVTKKVKSSGCKLLPLVAVQTASSSAAHLTKYSNTTSLITHQKKLIVDEAVIPPQSLFDYRLTTSMSPSFTCDGAFDGLSHCLEVYYGAPPDKLWTIEKIALTGIELILANLEKALANPDDLKAREALGLATDLGGYAIMMGGTNGAHLTSFSLVDVLSHGRACALLNPYYTVFFAPSIQKQLRRLAQLFSGYGLVHPSAVSSHGKDLGITVAQGLINFSKRINFPTSLQDIPGIGRDHIARALKAAKNPQLAMKLKNMPVSMTPEMVEEYMRPVLEAAFTGDIDVIKTPTSKKS